MLFQDSRPYACTRQNEPEHQAGRPASDDAAARCGRRLGHAYESIRGGRLHQGRWKCAFVLEQPPLGLELTTGLTARISAQSIACYDAMTRNDDGHGVSRHDLSDCAGRYP